MNAALVYPNTRAVSLNGTIEPIRSKLTMLPNPMTIERVANILVIEDEPKIARWLVSLMEQANFSVTTAPDGATGLRLVAATARRLGRRRW